MAFQQQRNRHMHPALFIKGGCFRVPGERIARQGKLIITTGRMRVDLVLVADDSTAIDF